MQRTTTRPSSNKYIWILSFCIHQEFDLQIFTVCCVLFYVQHSSKYFTGHICEEICPNINKVLVYLIHKQLLHHT